MRWHRHRWRLLWRWKSRSRAGRPHLSPEIQDLIADVQDVVRAGLHCPRSARAVHVNVTANPTAAGVWRQLIEATAWGAKPRHLLRDRDAVYGRDFRERARRIGIDAIATPIHAPKANAIAERVIGTLRRECLDHLIVLEEQHLASVLRDFVG